MSNKSINVDPVGWRIPVWGQRYGLPRSTAYALIKNGNGPRVTKIPGTDISIVTLEADAEWRSILNRGAA